MSAAAQTLLGLMPSDRKHLADVAAGQTLTGAPCALSRAALTASRNFEIVETRLGQLERVAHEPVALPLGQILARVRQLEEAAKEAGWVEFGWLPLRALVDSSTPGVIAVELACPNCKLELRAEVADGKVEVTRVGYELMLLRKLAKAVGELLEEEHGGKTEAAVWEEMQDAHRRWSNAERVK